MTEGFAIQFMNDSDVMIRIFPDVHLKCQSVNLEKAREILGDRQLTEEQMVEQAGEIIDRVGVKVSVRAVVQQKFTDLLEKEGYSLKRVGIVEKQTPSDDSGDQGDDNQGGNGGGGFDTGS